MAWDWATSSQATAMIGAVGAATPVVFRWLSSRGRRFQAEKQGKRKADADFLAAVLAREESLVAELADLREAHRRDMEDLREQHRQDIEDLKHRTGVAYAEAVEGELRRDRVGIAVRQAELETKVEANTATSHELQRKWEPYRLAAQKAAQQAETLAQELERVKSGHQKKTLELGKEIEEVKRRHDEHLRDCGPRDGQG